MASGEILLEGAVAYLVGEADQGLKQMMEQVNLSRLSHGVRAAAMMRRCVNEAMVCARTAQRVRQHHHRLSAAPPPAAEDHAAGRTVAVDVPVRGRRAWTAPMPARSDAENCLRILTPLLKFRACRDNIPVATGAMEVRGGNGYIEEWVHARLVRDAHIGVLWEGTSNINALDIITRAVGKSRAHQPLAGGAGEIAR